ncbi:competence protein CoiA [Halalkalibacter okhensis]|uniref:competence protein CoiA n=1 Tax=Halalkalibacter okhensis TaxID=333138 RepID=UPI00068E18D6|nr:competence protein CoiA family protein [Halalkalibacter okhensis]
MFNAKFADGTIISMADQWHIDELKELRKKRTFFCPACHSQVQLKLGTSKLWHFAHQANNICIIQTEKETLYHLKGKRKLYDWLKSQKLKVGMEVYLPLIRQRPDILFRNQNTLYALEFQCSPIESTLLKSRTEGYLQLGMVPIWILGGNRLKRHGPHSYSLKSFEWHTTRNFIDQQQFLTYFCPEQESFVFLQQLTPYSSTRILATYQEISLTNSSLNTLLNPSKHYTQLLDKWLTIRKHWRYHQPNPYPSKTEKFLQSLLYRRRIAPSLFPIEAGWPTNHYELISSAPCHWQTYLLLECLENQPLYQPFSIHLAIHCIQPYLNNNIFTLRSMNDDRHWTLAIMGFFHFLVKIGYLEQTPKRYFKRLKNAIAAKTVDEAIQYDQTLYYNTLVTIMRERNEGKNKGISSLKSNI